MRALRVIFAAPRLDFLPCIPKVDEPVCIQTFVTQSSIETLDQSVLYRLAREAESTLMHGTIVVATARRVISEDGKVMTITYKGSDLTGRQVDMTLVYEKK